MSRKQTIIENMIKILNDNNRVCVWYGDIDLIEKCAILSSLPQPHPQKTIITILNAVDGSSEFIKGYIFSDITGVKRKYRCFTLNNHSSSS